MADFDWEPFEGSKWTANDIGDEIVGTITLIHTERGQRGDVAVVTVAPKEGGPEKEIWCSTDLQMKFAEIKPQVGDLLAAKLIELRQVGQPQPMKVFAVKHKAGNGATPAPAPADDFEDGTEPF